jgi:3'-phosphoadenosine 5'-phosphosulfate sulfotransferase (PAPS reductase)/FAD synthetase
VSRRVVNFSCGAASAVAAKLTLSKDPAAVVVNVFVAEEHEDNRRFLRDVEAWIGAPVVVLRDEKYGASAYEVMRQKRFTKSQHGAPCAKAVKRDVLDGFAQVDDIVVLGFTAEEKCRVTEFAKTHPLAEFPVYEAGITKADCFALIQRAGIQLPAMYRMGYNNANCIGCVKGGAGYWNKIREDFPARFEEMCRLEESIGDGAYLMRDRATRARIPLRQLDPRAGRHNAVLPDCGLVCETVSPDMEWGVSP